MMKMLPGLRVWGSMGRRKGGDMVERGDNRRCASGRRSVGQSWSLMALCGDE